MIQPPDIRSLTREELGSRVLAWGEPTYRLDQVLDWLYPKSAESWEEMTNLPRALRERLASEFQLHLPHCASVQGSGDATQKFLWRLADGALIESVLIPANPALYGEASDRRTLCVSTQVGCAYACRFCASGLGGWKRNLKVDEIVGQAIAIERRWRDEAKSGDEPEIVSAEAGGFGGSGSAVGSEPTSRAIDNLVIMGMGEPLANYDHLLKALRILNAPWGLNIGARKITVSTSGLVPEIRKLASEPFQFGLAISLHGATNPVRDQLMPVNHKYPLEQLVAACEDYWVAKRRTITLEYILIAGVNDARSQVAPLATIARRLRAKVNLIPYNRVDGLNWERPGTAQQETFLKALVDRGVRATLRREKGHDIDAACGQLRLRHAGGLAEEAGR